jgi:menaquinol-cytochrome c reductase iron-sulfur subunit
MLPDAQLAPGSPPAERERCRLLPRSRPTAESKALVACIGTPSRGKAGAMAWKPESDAPHTGWGEPPPEKPEVEFPGRRSFLSMLLAVGTTVVGALLAIPLARFTLHPLLETTTETAWSDIGDLTALQSETLPVSRMVTVEQRDGWRSTVAQRTVYVVSGPAGLRVLSPVCPHLGCTIAWRQQDEQFLCPCHVGVFTNDGRRVSGPIPRDMDELESRVHNGVLQVRYQFFRQLVPHREVLA